MRWSNCSAYGPAHCSPAMDAALARAVWVSEIFVLKFVSERARFSAPFQSN